MYEQLERNVRRTWFLMGGFILVVLGVGYLFGAIFGAGPTGLILALVFSAGLSFVSYRSGDKIVLRMSRAREVTHEQEPRLHNLVEGLAIAAGIPKPRVHIVEDEAPNAFATGRDPEHASIAVTTGLLAKLNRVELEGVIAHELAHVKNRDTLVLAVVATLVGSLVLLADWTMRGMLFGGRGRDRGGIAPVFMIFGLLGVVLMPILAKVMQSAVSRRREYLADVSGVQFTRYPPGLLSALEKLRDDRTVVHSAVHATSALWIESPLDKAGTGFPTRLNRLFDTHPPLEERIRLLREL